MKIYLTTNINHNEPEIVRASTYIHVKTKVDGSQTLILTEELLVDEKVEQLTKEQAQSLLDDWIDSENSVEKINEATGQSIVQSYINLDIYV